MLNIGCHLSVAQGFTHMGEEALGINANTFQYFTRNPRGSSVKKLEEDDLAGLLRITREHQFAQLLGHAPYTLNACSASQRIREFTQMAMTEDLANMEHLPGNLYNFHPGSHVGQGIEEGIRLIAAVLNQILLPEQSTLVLLETMSGKGSEVGSSFNELQAIIKRTELADKLGVCLDTCHVYSAGYDIVNNLDGVLEEFDAIIGLDKLKAIHLNDSMTPFASHKDRHARISEGSIGFEAIVNLINHPQLCCLPFYLETPNDVSGYGDEIKLLRENFQIDG